MDLQYIRNRYKNWHYKNTTLLFLTLVALFYLKDSGIADQGILQIQRLGYPGAFLTGILFVSTFTIAPAVIVLFNLAKTMDPLALAVLAGLGGMVGDYVIYSFLKDGVFDELKPGFMKLFSSPKKIFSSPFFAWFTPLLGAVLIASPLPDEIGLGLLGMSHLSRWQFLLLTFCLDTLGVLLIILLARA